MSAPVLLTGATGYLGPALARELAAAGRPVHVLARSAAGASVLGDLPERVHVADLLDPPSLARAVRDLADGAPGPPDVVHAAAVVSYRTSDGELQRRANVEGTRALAEAARAAGVRRFVQVSSVVAAGPAASPEESLDEDAPFDGARLRCDYVDTKRAAELAALAAGGGGLEVVVASPGAVFGPSARPSNTARFLAAIVAHPALGLLAPPGSLSVVGVEDVARGVRLALERGAPGRRYLLCESAVRLADLYRMVFERVGRGRVLATVPPAPWRVVCAGAALVDRVRPLSFAAPQALRLLGAHLRCSGERARRELGWRPAPFARVLDGALTALACRR